MVVADFFQPVDVLAVERFLNGDVSHGCCGGGAMPMLLAGREPDHISWAYFFDRPALTLDPAQSRRDDQCLAERVRVPRGARAGLEGDVPAVDAPGRGRLEQWINADGTGEPVGGPLARRFGAASFDVHSRSPWCCFLCRCVGRCRNRYESAACGTERRVIMRSAPSLRRH